MIVSGGQQSESVIHIHGSTLPQTSLPSRLLHNVDQSSMCDTVSPCWLSILNIGVCTCWSQSPQLSLPFIFYPNTRFFKNSNCLLDISSFMFYRLLKHVPKWNGIFFSHLNLFLFLSSLSQWLVLPFPSQKLDIILTHPQLQRPSKIVNSSQFS